MSEIGWQALAVVAVIIGFAYCGHEKQESYRECIRHHAAKECQ